MITFVALLLAVVVVGVIVFPLFRARATRVVRAGDEALRELASKRDTNYSMLKELEFDYQSGILVEDDYRALENRYKQKAISTLREIDALASDAEDEVERQVRRLRRGKGRPGAIEAGDAIEREIMRRRQGKQPATVDAGVVVEQEIRQRRQGDAVPGSFCAQCGARAGETDRFCSGCGAKLKDRGKAS